MGSLHRSKVSFPPVPACSDADFRFWELGVNSASSTSQRRFVECFGHYTDSVVQQAKDRHHRYIRNIDDYFDVRRLTIGVYPPFAMLELGYDLPDDVFYHPTVVALQSLARDMIILDNVRLF